MEKKNKKPLIFIGLLVSVFLVVGVTLAYYTTTDTYTNIFNTGSYDIEMIETFVSPDNWTPGTTTPKTIIATNHGTTPAAVRVKLTPSWEDKNGDPLPLTDGTNEAAIINFNSNLNRKWVYQDGYYYYKRALNENQSTTTLLNSVTFNPEVTFDKTRDCDTVNGVTTCTTTFNDYAGGKYTLKIDVETCQYDQYQEIWNTNVSLNDPILVDGTLMQHDDDATKTFGKNINRDSFESITTIDNKNVPEGAIDSWDVSAEQNGSVMAWYLDADNDSKYELYIGQEDGVKANPDSSNAFCDFSSVELIDLSNFDTSRVTTMSGMFKNAGYNATSFNIVGLSGWDTSSVTHMGTMFFSAGYNATTWSIGDLSGWDTSSVTIMGSMFFNAGYNATTFNIVGLSGWDTSSVTTMSGMLEYVGRSATTWSIGDLSGWDTSSVTDMGGMFKEAGYSAQTFNIGDLSGWDTSRVTYMGGVFAFTGYSATTWSIGDLSGWDTSRVTNMDGMFTFSGYNATTWSIGDLSGWDTSRVTTMDTMFAYAGYNATTWNSIGTLKVYTKYINSIFNCCKNAKATLNIYSNPSGYSWAFSDAATVNGSGITVNYSSTTINIFNIVGTKSSNSNVVKGSQLD